MALQSLFIRGWKQLSAYRPCVARSLAIAGKSSYIRHTDRVSVMVLAMCSNLFLRSSMFNGSVCRNHIMITAPLPP